MNWQDIPIDNLELSLRSHNCLLHRTPWRTIGEVAAATDAELLAIPNLGKVSLREIREVISYSMPAAPAPEPVISEHDVIQWALAHLNLMRALIAGEAEIRVR